MALDAAGLPQTPNDLRSLGRRVLQLERQLQMSTAARSLVSAAVGRGGIRVTEGGSIVVEAGGSVIIETGNLILGDGLIEGSALEEQVSAEHGEGHGTGRAVGSTWATHASTIIETPEWAEVAIIQAFGVGRNRLTNTDGTIFTIISRLNLAGEPSAENLTSSTLTGDQGQAENFHHLSWERVYTDLTPALQIDYQLRAEDGSVYGQHASNRADVAATVIFMRG